MTRVEILREKSGFPPPGAAVPGAPPVLDSQQATGTAQHAPATATPGMAVGPAPDLTGRSALPVDLSDPRLLYSVSGALVVAAGLLEYWGRRRFAHRAARR